MFAINTNMVAKRIDNFKHGVIKSVKATLYFRESSIFNDELSRRLKVNREVDKIYIYGGLFSQSWID